MTIENKGPSPKGGRYLVCSAAKRGLECVSGGWRYDHFEKSFLRFVEQVDLQNLLGELDPEKMDLEETLRALEGRQVVLHKDVETAWQMRQQGESKYLAERIYELEGQLGAVEENIMGTKAAIKNHETARRAFNQSKDEIKLLIQRLQDRTAKREELYKQRSQVADQIKAIAEEVEVATRGAGPLMLGEVEYMNPKHAKSARRGMFTEQRFFLVTFKDHSTLGVIPPDDPFNVEHYQVFETSEPFSVTQGDLQLKGK